MPKIEELTYTPGKGMVAMEGVDCLTIDDQGLFGDREYMWVEGEPHQNVLYHRGQTAEPGHFLSLREDPGLTQIVPTPQPDGVTMQTRRGEDALFIPRAVDIEKNWTRVSVWGWDGLGVDQGDEAAAWGTEAIGRPVRLVAVSSENPRWVEGNPALGRVGFADAYPVTVGSTESIDLVNEQLAVAGQASITAKRPRVTMVLSGLVLPNRAELPGNVFLEDYVEEIRVGTGGLSVVLRRLKACGRCPVPDTDEVTGERKGAPVRQALGRLSRNGRHADQARYGSGPELFWTQNFVIKLRKGMKPGTTINIEKGAEVEVVYSENTNWA